MSTSGYREDDERLHEANREIDRLEKAIAMWRQTSYAQSLALQKAFVAMKVAAALPGIQSEYDFGEAIASCESVLFEKPADALSAAAPELLRACEIALGAFERNDAIDWSILERAIAKAKGRQHEHG